MNFKENKAIYLQIAELLMDEILQNKYAEEDRIPSVREYAANVEVNVNTCMRAYDWLCSQDVIFTKRGLGYFVSPGARDSILVVRKKEFYDEFVPELIQKMNTLNITKDELLKAIK